MEDSSPPYPGHQGQPKEQLPSISEPDSTCSYLHILLITTTSPLHKSATTVTTLHHWSLQSQPKSSLNIIQTKLDINSLRNIKDFQELGTFNIPIEAVSTGPHGVYAHLTSFLTESSTDFSSDKEIVAYIISHLTFLSEPCGPKSLPLHFYSIPVFSDRSEGITVNGLFPVWKWAKPSSSYSRKTGHWEVEAMQAIEDGVWTAGKDLILFVRGVDEEKLEYLRTHKTNFLAL
ncbi:hypothetical protein NHQ30_006775 [Ciborinia camelliae]|nr:hypothetical protein NHQ30_006775 [Ciborinia camelliae]